jgi:hypothetical protein
MTNFIYQEEETNGLTDGLLLMHNQYWIIQFSNVLKQFLRTNSGIVERFETFLIKEVHDSSDGAPGHPLWGSFYQELGAPCRHSAFERILVCFAIPKAISTF